MQRLHLWEIADQPWCPPALRRYAYDAIAVVQEVTGAFDAVVPLLHTLLEGTRARRVVDLCAGSGGPWRRLLPPLVERGLVDEVLLTDQTPPPAPRTSFDGRLRACATPVDATAAPRGDGDLRTLFNGLHHLRWDEARSVLLAAVDDEVPIAVFEVVERRPAVLLFIVFLLPVLVVLTAPLVRPLSLSRLALTWLVPVVPGLVVIDGLLSCLRAYSPEALRRLVRSVPGHERFV
jgi:hypothetical protein